MTGKSTQEDIVSRRELIRAAGAAAVVGSAVGSVTAVGAEMGAKPPGGMSAATNEICRWTL